MAQKTIQLNLQPGQFMTWTISAQAAYHVYGTLKDDSKIYCEFFNNANPSFSMKSGHDKIEGNNLRLEVNITEAQQLLVAESTGELVASPSGEVVGYSRAYGFEDAGDGDYNDLMLSIITTKKSN